ncbi:hypothetical protein Shyd_00270 [Streptomyces hydrogenans]|uniref:Uncharacterized protein n=1 Tax=Streptomyces hydrogenans TaxID=1873719 RepID=A0ABQ3P0V1_9ACTN|nr:hypothetical protein [Streptomyces hydrogenans]GHI18656.1 hypothetical protein Shyd_00270 [Streptomyces hydrogenans]
MLSTLSPGHIDMRTVESTQTRRISLVCPACKTWVAVTPHRGTYLLKLVPHHTGKAGVDAAIRCSSSNRLVDVNITPDTWSRQYEEWAREERLAVDLTRHRRATVQTLKVARPQERPADRRAQWERGVPAAPPGRRRPRGSCRRAPHHAWSGRRRPRRRPAGHDPADRRGTAVLSVPWPPAPCASWPTPPRAVPRATSSRSTSLAPPTRTWPPSGAAP